MAVYAGLRDGLMVFPLGGGPVRVLTAMMDFPALLFDASRPVPARSTSPSARTRSGIVNTEMIGLFWGSLHPAMSLSRRLRRNDALPPRSALDGLSVDLDVWMVDEEAKRLWLRSVPRGCTLPPRIRVTGVSTPSLARWSEVATINYLRSDWHGGTQSRWQWRLDFGSWP